MTLIFAIAILYLLAIVGVNCAVLQKGEFYGMFRYYKPVPDCGGFVDRFGNRVEHKILWRAWGWPVVVLVSLLLFPLGFLCIAVYCTCTHRWGRLVSGNPAPIYAGGDGSSREAAIVINADNPLLAVQSEYGFIQMRYGPRGLAWKREMQVLVKNGRRRYDVLTIKFLNGDGHEKVFWFDITNVSGG